MDRFGLLLPLAWRSLWRNPRRTIITVLVVSVGLWSILTFAALLDAWSVSSRDTTLKMMTSEGEIHAPGYRDDPTVVHRMPLPDAAMKRVLESPAVTGYTMRVRIGAIVQSEYRTLPVTLVGAIPARERALSVLPNQIAKGRYLAGPGDAGIVIGRELAKRLKTRAGKRVVIMAQDANGKLAERAFEIVGFFAGPHQVEDEFAFTGIEPAQAFTGIGMDVSEVAFNAASDEVLPGVIARLRKLAPRLDVESWETLAPLPYAVSTFFDEFVLMWLWIMFTLIAIGIVNTQLMAVFERTREFGLLQALGMRPHLVLFEVALESAFLIGIGVLLGVVFGLVTVSLFPDGLDLGFLGRGAELVGAGHILYPRANAGDFALYGFIVWALGVIATLWPARRASKTSPVEAMGHV